MTQNREFKPHTPPAVVIKAVLIAVVVTGFVVAAIYEAGRGIREARLTGTVVSKEFVPAGKEEQQITLFRDGEIAVKNVEGDFILNVEVKMPEGGTRQFRVWLPDRARYEAISVGDSFDVGPYLVK